MGGIGAAPHEVSASPDEQQGKLNEGQKTERRYFGVRLGTLLLFAALLCLIIAAIIGGTVGGVLSRKSKASHGQDSQIGQQNSSASSSATLSSPSPTSTSSATPSATVTKALEPIRQIAACESDVTIFIAHQDGSGDIYFRAYYNEPSDWTQPKKINLTTAAANNTPLTCTCWHFSDYFELRIFYRSVEDDLTQIMTQCPSDGSGCSTFDFSTGTNVKLALNSSLAMTTPWINELRIYALGDDGTISERSSRTGTLLAIQGSPKAHPNSPLAVDMLNDDINLFWFNEAFQLQTSRSNSSSYTWNDAETLPGDSPTELPQALAVAISEDPEVIQVFYMGSSSFGFMEKRDGKWGAGAFSSSVTASSLDYGPIAAVGWNNTSVRMYYVVDGQITELAYENSYGWAAGTMTPYSYD